MVYTIEVWGSMKPPSPPQVRRLAQTSLEQNQWANLYLVKFLFLSDEAWLCTRNNYKDLIEQIGCMDTFTTTLMLEHLVE